MTSSTGEHLTTSRISRLLRPLRAKCLKLASYTPEKPFSSARGAVAVKYGSSSRHNSVESTLEQDEAPLAVIPPPEKLSALSKLDRASRAKLEYSRRIYDVRDAFRNVIQAVLQPASTSRRSSPLGPTHTPESHIRSLAALCATTVGENIEDQIQLVKEETEDADSDEDEHLKVVNTLYEAVYPHYRKYTIIAHALTIVISICSSEHTLLTTLLDVTVTHNLLPESRLLLLHIFRCVMHPSAVNPSTALPICHPAHSRYLTHLLETCDRLPALNEEAFMNTLSEALGSFSPHASVEFWTCKAVVRLSRTLRSRDYTVFLSMCSSAITFLSSHTGLASRCRGKAPMPNDGLNSVAERLGKWLSHACQCLYDVCSSTTEQSSPQELAIISDILARADACQLHRLQWSADAEVLQNAIASLAVLCVAPPTSAYLTPAARNSCHSILCGIEPKAGLFEILVAVATPQTPETEYLSTANFTSSTIPALQRWAHALRDQSYHLLESSLWSSALSYIESLTPEIGSHYDPVSHHSTFHSELERLRCDIVRRVENAERRCFNERGELQVLSTQTPRKGTLANGEWRWEDLVGCWVQKTPVCAAIPAVRAKRRRSAREDAPVALKHARRDTVSVRSGRPPERAASVSSSITSSTTVIAPRRPSTLHLQAPKPSAVHNSAKALRLAGQENALSPRGKPAPSRRVSNFTSILRDAQVNRIVLHPDRLDDEDGAWLRDSGDAMQRHPAATQSSLSEDEVDADLEAAEHPSSDDVLDLFAYRSSDW